MVNKLLQMIDEATFSVIKEIAPCNISDVMRKTGLSHFEVSLSVKRLEKEGKVNIKAYSKFKIISIPGGENETE